MKILKLSDCLDISQAGDLSPLHTFCKLEYDQTKIVHLRLTIEKLQYVNKNLLTCLQQDQAPPIYLKFFLNR